MAVWREIAIIKTLSLKNLQFDTYTIKRHVLSTRRLKIYYKKLTQSIYSHELIFVLIYENIAKNI